MMWTKEGFAKRSLASAERTGTGDAGIQEAVKISFWLSREDLTGQRDHENIKSKAVLKKNN